MTRRQKLGTVIGRLPENLRKGYSRIQVDGLSDDEFDTLLGEVTAEVDGIAKEATAESRNFVPDVPEKFGKWIDDNRKRIGRAKSLPYFMRDNEKYIKPLTITPQARAGADEAQRFNEVMMRAAGQKVVNPFKESRTETLAWAKSNLAGSSVNVEKLNKPVVFTVTGIKEALNQPHKHYIAKNVL